MEGKYAIADDYYLISGDMKSYINFLRTITRSYAGMLLDWASHGYRSELDLFVTRSILWYIVMCLIH